MSNTFFDRYEYKFLIDRNTYLKLTSSLDEYMVMDDYGGKLGQYSICNIYYDTDNDYYIRKSIDKPIYKEKLRLRSYGRTDGNSEVFIELKKKYKGKVNKRRITMTLSAAMEYLNNGIVPVTYNGSRHVFREIEYMRNRYALVPKVYLSYDRIAYYGKDNRDFRITFDSNLTARREELRLDLGSYGDKLLPEENMIMEVKIMDAVPLWLAHLLSEHRIYKTSFSKYGTEYKNFLQQVISEGDKAYVWINY